MGQFKLFQRSPVLLFWFRLTESTLLDAELDAELENYKYKDSVAFVLIQQVLRL